MIQVQYTVESGELLTLDMTKELQQSLQLPGYDPCRDAGDCYFDQDDANLYAEFFPECLTFSKGEWAGQPFELAAWQLPIILNLFGWKRPDGTRRYRTTLLFVPRKNGKTELCAGIIIACMFLDNEPGAQLFSLAADADQANLVFDTAMTMIEGDPELDSRTDIFKSYRTIEHPSSGSVYRRLSGDKKGKHGLNPHVYSFDELHEQQDEHLKEAVESALGARRQPLALYATTSDFDGPSPCNEEVDYARGVRDGVNPDPYYLPIIYEAAPDDDWKDPVVWAKANPNYPVTPKHEFLEHQIAQAAARPSKENTIKRLYLNIRTGQKDRWISMDHWNACGGKIDKSDLVGQRCFAGLDLANTVDIAAFVLFFPDNANAILPFFWIPKERTKEKTNEFAYRNWIKAGYIDATDGDVIDYKAIRKKINALSKLYRIQEIGYDPWNATQISLQLSETDGLPMIEFRQGYASMNEPCKRLEMLAVDQSLRHGDNPVLSWMASNVAIREDPAGNIKIDKKKSSEKVDGMVALAMAIGRALVNEIEKKSVYEDHGIRTV